jgi:hypothetical protein
MMVRLPSAGLYVIFKFLPPVILKAFFLFFIVFTTVSGSSITDFTSYLGYFSPFHLSFGMSAEYNVHLKATQIHRICITHYVIVSLIKDSKAYHKQIISSS